MAATSRRGKSPPKLQPESQPRRIAPQSFPPSQPSPSTASALAASSLPPKSWRAALETAALSADETGKPALTRAAEALFQAAIAGNMSALKEIGERLDGRARAESESDREAPAFVISAPEIAETAEAWIGAFAPSAKRS